MTDVSAWDPVDDNNNSAPPAGWPEGMMPSTVNNTARMMMGAVRREHDRIVGQIGSTAGTIATTTLNVTTVNASVVNAGGGMTAQTINVVDNLVVGGDLSFGSRLHGHPDGSNNIYIGCVGPEPGNIAYGLSTDGAGTVTALSFLTYGVARLTINNSGISTPSTLTAAQLNSTGAINATLDVTGRDAYFRNLNFTGTFTGSLPSNVTVGGTLTGSTVTATSQLISNGTLNVHGIAGFDTNATVGGALGIVGDLSLSGRFTVTGGYIWCYSSIIPSGNGSTNCGQGGNAWAGVASYSFTNVSDGRWKTDIKALPDNCSALVEAIIPKRYRWREQGILDTKRTHWGFIAQEIDQAFREAGLDFGGHTVGDDEDKTEALDVNELVAVLWGAVRELTGRVKQLETALAR